MKVTDSVGCARYPCIDVRHECYLVPDIEVDPETISMVMISEAAPADPSDYYYAKGDGLFEQTTVQAFRDAGAEV